MEYNTEQACRVSSKLLAQRMILHPASLNRHRKAVAMAVAAIKKLAIACCLLQVGDTFAPAPWTRSPLDVAEQPAGVVGAHGDNNTLGHREADHQMETPRQWAAPVGRGLWRCVIVFTLHLTGSSWCPTRSQARVELETRGSSARLLASSTTIFGGPTAQAPCSAAASLKTASWSAFVRARNEA